MKCCQRSLVRSSAVLCILLLFGSWPFDASAAAPKSIPIADLKRQTPVDFQTEILPVLRNNCLPCHNQTKAKAHLVLETPETILKGSDSGPVVVPGHADESLLLRAAAHQTAETIMPPDDNKVNAVSLTSEQLGLVKLWINQGAKGEVREKTELAWHSLANNFHPVYALSVTPDGQLAAAGRGNHILVFHLPSQRWLGELADPDLSSPNFAGAAHQDLVHCLAFNPAGTMLASGGYREVKLWEQVSPKPQKLFEPPAGAAISAMAVSSDRAWLALGLTSGRIELRQLTEEKPSRQFVVSDQPIQILKFSAENDLLACAADRTLAVWRVADGIPLARTEATNVISALGWLPGGQILSGDTAALASAWELPAAGNAAWKPAKEFKAAKAAITAIEPLGTNAKTFAMASADGLIRLWNWPEAKTTRQLSHGRKITALACRPDGKRLASASDDGSIKIWDPATGKEITSQKGNPELLALIAPLERRLKFSEAEIAYHKGKLQSGESDRKTQTDRLAKAQQAKSEAEKAFAEKEKKLATEKQAKAAAETAVAQLKQAMQSATNSFQTAQKEAERALAAAKEAFQKSRQAEVAADRARQIKTDLEKVAADAAKIAAPTNSILAPDKEDPLLAEASAVARKARTAAESLTAETKSKSQNATQASTEAEKALQTLLAKAEAAGRAKAEFDRAIAAFPEKEKQTAEKIKTTGQAFAAAEKEFAKAELGKSSASKDVELIQRELERSAEIIAASKQGVADGEKELARLKEQLAARKNEFAKSNKIVRSLAFSPDGTLLAAGTEDDRLLFLQAETGAVLATLPVTASPDTLAFLNSDEVIAAGGAKPAMSWDWRPRWALAGRIGNGRTDSPLVDRVHALAFSPDGQLLATGGGEPSRSGEIKLWNIRDRTLARDLNQVHSDTVLGLDFSPDGKYLASGAADKFVKVVELSSGKVKKTFEGHTHHVLDVAWKADGRTLASSGADGFVKFWNFLTGEPIKTVGGFEKEVTSIQFVGFTGETLVTSGDARVKLVETDGREIRSFSGETDFVFCGAATLDGKLVLAGGEDGVVRVWDGLNGKAMAELIPPAVPPPNKLAQAEAGGKSR